MGAEKRGQITLMMILGIVMIMIVGFLLFISKSALRDQLQDETGRVHTTNMETDPIRAHVNICLDTLTKEGLSLLGKQGGILYDTRGIPLITSLSRNIDDFTIDYQDMKIAYGIKPLGLSLPPYEPRAPGYPFRTFPYRLLPPLSANLSGVFGLNSLPPLTKLEGPFSMEQQLEIYIEKGMRNCLDFSTFEDQGYEFEAVLGEADIIFGEKDVSVIFSYPSLIVNTVTNEKLKLDRFTSRQKVKFKDLYTFLSTLIKHEITDINFNLSYPGIIPPQYSFEFIQDVEQNDDLVIIKDRESLLLGKEYEFRFARKNRAPALYFMTPENIDVFDQTEVTEEVILPAYLEFPTALDPDEDNLMFTFTVIDVPSQPALPQKLTRGTMIVRVRVTDGTLEDYQDITINNAGPQVFPDCETRPVGCYDDTLTSVPYNSLLAGVDTFGNYLPRELCFKNNTCECAPGTFTVVLEYGDPDEAASACGCFRGSDWSDFNGCCGDEEADCGVLGKGSCIADPPVCGDGRIQAGEHCDGTVFGAANQCIDLGFTGGLIECSPFCTLDTAGCLSTTCGNGVINQGEECDGINFGTFIDNTCIDLSDDFSSGLLECNNCQISTDNCVEKPSCGNDVVDEPGEQCDDSDFGGISTNCGDYSNSFISGTLACDSLCQLDTINCIKRTCGNGIVDVGEECDGTNFGNVYGACNSFSPEFTGGSLICDSTCRIDTSSCLYSGTATDCYSGSIIPGKTCAFNAGVAVFGAIDECTDYPNFIGGDLGCWGECRVRTTNCIPRSTCGNGAIDVGETCDGTTFGAFTQCTDFEHFDGGPLQCTSSCQLDTFGCTIPLTGKCGNGIVNTGEICEGGSLACPEAGAGVSGTITCSNCGADLSDCQAYPTCGNGVLDPSEQCDGFNFGLLTGECSDYSNQFNTGRLLCNPDCTLNTETCVVDPDCATTGVLATSSAICSISTNLQNSNWFDTAIYAYDIVYIPCMDKEFLSTGTTWIPCNEGEVRKVNDLGPSKHDYLCIGREGFSTWFECCGNGACQSLQDGGRLVDICPSCSGSAPGPQNTITDYLGVTYTCGSSSLTITAPPPSPAPAPAPAPSPTPPAPCGCDTTGNYVGNCCSTWTGGTESGGFAYYDCTTGAPVSCFSSGNFR